MLAQEPNAEASESCVSNARFERPTNDDRYEEGGDVYVRVDPEERRDVDSIELYVNGRLVGTDSKHPFEWAKGGGSSDSHLRNLKPGTYKLKARLKTDCDTWGEFYATFYVVRA